MSAVAIPGIGHNGGPRLRLPKFEPWRLLRPLKMFDGQFYPFQPLQFMDGSLAPPPGFVSGVSSLTFVDDGNSTNTATCTIPAAGQTGDIAIFFDGVTNTSAITKVIPAGWTELAYAATASGFNRVALACSYKVLAGGEAGTSITGMSHDQENKWILVFRPDATITTVTPSTWSIQTTTGNPTSQTVSASGQPTPLLVLGVCHTESAVTFSTASPAFDAEFVNNGALGRSMRVGYKIYNSSPADHSIDMNDFSNNNLASGYIRVA